MLRFLRRYNKILLMVGGSILMVLFLLPTTATQMGQNVLSQSIGTVDGEKVTIADLRPAQDELSILGQTMPELLIVFGFEDPRRPVPERWLLLVHEARNAGLIGHVEDGAGFIEPASVYASEIRQQFAFRQGVFNTQGLEPSVVRAEMERRRSDLIAAGQPSARIDTALANARGVLRLIESSSPRAVFSTREMIAAGKRLLDTATFGMVLIPATSVMQDIPEPDEARIAEHFEKYKGIRSAEDPSGMGYLRPDAVKIEYFKIDRGIISSALTIDPIEVNKYWRQNQTRFGPDFAAQKARVETAYRESRLDDIFARMDRVVRQETFRSVSGFPTDGVYRTLPADWAEKMPAINALTQTLDAELQKLVPAKGAVTAVSDAQWRDFEQVQALGGIGGSRIKLSDIDATFAPYVMSARELLRPEAPLRVVTGVQVGMIHGPLTDFANNAYYVRLLDARREGPPESVEEVRALVVNDLKTIDALKMLEANKGEHVARAVTDGMMKLGESAGAPATWGFEATRTAVRQSGAPVSNPDLDYAGLRDAIIGVAEKLDPRVDPTSIDPGMRTVAVQIPRARALAVAQVTRWRPMTREAFKSNVSRIALFAGRDTEATSATQVFSTERLSERHNFKPRDGEVIEREETAASPEAPGEPAGS